MAGKKTLIGVPLAAIVAIAGGSFAFDFSQTTSTETNISGDTNVVVNNYIADNFGVDVNVFREMCRNDEVPDEAKVYCRLIGA